MMQVRAGPDLTSPTSTGRACQTLTLCFSQWKEWGHGGRVKKVTTALGSCLPGCIYGNWPWRLCGLCILTAMFENQIRKVPACSWPSPRTGAKGPYSSRHSASWELWPWQKKGIGEAAALSTRFLPLSFSSWAHASSWHVLLPKPSSGCMQPQHTQAGSQLQTKTPLL